VVRRAWTDARGLFEARGVDLLLAEPGAPLWVDGDAARLAQLVGNLLHNALKFTPPGGHVRVGVERRGATCEIAVSDDGAGVDGGDLARIFEPFVQSSRTAAASGGLGIGLALVRELATRHGGTVRAESAGQGQGARFLVELPVQAAPPRPGPGDPAPAPPAGLAILVVEDNVDAAATLADLLALSGHRVETAGTGRAGIAAAAARPPDFVICDVGLPDVNGFSVIRAIRAQPGGHRPFALALTGYAQPDDRAAALAAGFDAHLAKPPSLEELDRLLAEVAHRREVARAEAASAAP
jgi:CheY-like chemotaxis protein